MSTTTVKLVVGTNELYIGSDEIIGASSITATKNSGSSVIVNIELSFFYFTEATVYKDQNIEATYNYKSNLYDGPYFKIFKNGFEYTNIQATNKASSSTIIQNIDVSTTNSNSNSNKKNGKWRVFGGILIGSYEMGHPSKTSQKDVYTVKLIFKDSTSYKSSPSDNKATFKTSIYFNPVSNSAGITSDEGNNFTLIDPVYLKDSSNKPINDVTSSIKICSSNCAASSGREYIYLFDSQFWSSGFTPDETKFNINNNEKYDENKTIATFIQKKKNKKS